jgi:hypothetical protein
MTKDLRDLSQAARASRRGAEILAHSPTVMQDRSRSKQFRLLDVASEGNGARIPERPPSRLVEAGPCPQPREPYRPRSAVRRWKSLEPLPKCLLSLCRREEVPPCCPLLRLSLPWPSRVPEQVLEVLVIIAGSARSPGAVPLDERSDRLVKLVSEQSLW